MPSKAIGTRKRGRVVDTPLGHAAPRANPVLESAQAATVSEPELPPHSAAPAPAAPPGPEVGSPDLQAPCATGNDAASLGVSAGGVHAGSDPGGSNVTGNLNRLAWHLGPGESGPGLGGGGGLGPGRGVCGGAWCLPAHPGPHCNLL